MPEDAVGTGEAAPAVQEKPETITMGRSATAVLAVPVTLAASAMRRRYRHWWWLPGWLFAGMTQAPALLAIAWLIPGFAMLLAGRLTPVPMVIIFVPLAAALWYFAMRQLPVSWPRFETAGRQAGPASRRPDVPVVALVATLAVAAGFAVWQVARNGQEVIVNRDPGVYLQYGYWIAAHGSARIPQTAAAFGSGGGLALHFGTFGFFPNGASVSPSFMPGLPLVLAAGLWLGGVSGGLLMGPVAGGCAILSFAGLAGRLAGPRWAPAAALVLALTLPEQYVSRATLSEPLAQVLLFGGLCLVIDSLVVTRRRHASGAGARGAAPGGAPGTAPAAALVLAGFGGLALGLTVLVSIGSLSTLLPVFPVLALLFVARRAQAGPLAMGLFLGVACGLFSGLVLARPYLSSLSSQLRLFGLCAAGFGVVTALIAPLGFPSVRSFARRMLMGRARLWRWRLPSAGLWLQWLALALPFLLVAGAALRRYAQTTRGQTDPFVIRFVASLQHMAGVPVDGQRQYYELSGEWVLWYLGAPVVLLACFGAALLGRRLVRALLSRREALANARIWGLPFLIIVWSVVTVLWNPAVLPDQPWASRRLVPVVLPGLVLLAVWACSRLRYRAAELGARRLTASAVAVCCVLGLAIPAFVTSFDPVVSSSRVNFRGVAASRTGAGEAEAVTRLCSAIGGNASVVFVDAPTADSFAPVVRGICGQPAALVLGGTVAVEQAAASIEQARHRPVLLGASRSRLGEFGAVPQLVVHLTTTGDEQVLTGPPSGTSTLRYTVWMTSPLGISGSGSGS
jgi:hypothetical protein